MDKELLSFVVNVGETFMKAVPISLALAAVFSVLAWRFACNPGRPWWHKKDLVTDLCYWFFIPVLARYFRIGLLVAGAALLFHITTATLNFQWYIFNLADTWIVAGVIGLLGEILLVRDAAKAP